MTRQKNIQPAPLPIGQSISTARLPQPAQSRLETQHFGRGVAVMFLPFGGRYWPRPDEGHFTSRDMPELRQFVDRMPAAECCENARDARIVAGFDFGNFIVAQFVDESRLWRSGLTRPHRPELQHPERATFAAQAAMRHQRRATRQNPDRNAGDQQNRAQRDQRREADQLLDRRQQEFHYRRL